MKANVLQKSLITASLLVGLSATANAAEEPMSFSFETIVDVSIAELQALDFGEDLAITSNTNCTLLVSTTANPGSVAARQGLGTALPAGTTYQTRTGDCDNNGTGTAGIYTVTGAPGVDVTVTVNPIAPAGDIDFSFLPTGVAVNYVLDTGDDTLVDIASGADTDIRLAAAGDVSLTGSPIPGQTYVYVGGTLTAQRTLTAGTTYNTQTFIIDVVY
ncbi:hypothetical protein [Paraglaciecola sp. L1A13]|uniref:hypothetical protein n=1 Tax=Paraglaciecola sp. L1A13 TaxID=2686359 RepID=UPI00131BCD1C|nr:hypothetical protein [Paraglaciecola sp. L1A13]